MMGDAELFEKGSKLVPSDCLWRGVRPKGGSPNRARLGAGVGNTAVKQQVARGASL
jgi:hypothetical protein